MRERVGDRLPKFTDEDKIKPDSTDFIGLNHYTSRFAWDGVTNENTPGYRTDVGATNAPVLKNGKKIGYQLNPEWLWYYN